MAWLLRKSPAPAQTVDTNAAAFQAVVVQQHVQEDFMHRIVKNGRRVCSMATSSIRVHDSPTSSPEKSKAKQEGQQSRSRFKCQLILILIFATVATAVIVGAVVGWYIQPWLHDPVTHHLPLFSHLAMQACTTCPVSRKQSILHYACPDMVKVNGLNGCIAIVSVLPAAA